MVAYYMMLTQNLFYTGLTRAKRLAIIVDPKKAISLTLRSTEKQQRYTLGSSDHKTFRSTECQYS